MATGAKCKSTSKEMDQKYRTVLKKVRVKLVRDMEVDDVLLHMAASEVFCERDINNIKSKTTPEDKRETFLDILPRRGAKAYHSFIEALGEGCQPFLADIVKQAENIIELDSELATVRESSAGLKGKIRRLETEKQNLTKDVNKFKKEVETLKIQLNAQKMDTKGQKTDDRAELTHRKTDGFSIEMDFQKIIGRAEETKIEQERRHEEKSAEKETIKKLEKHIATLMQEKKELEDCQKIVGRAEEIKIEQERKHKEKSTEKVLERKLKERITKLMTEKKELEVKNETQRTELEKKTKLEMEKLRKDVNEWKIKSKTLEDEKTFANDLKSKCDRLEQENRYYCTEIKQLRKESKITCKTSEGKLVTSWTFKNCTCSLFPCGKKPGIIRYLMRNASRKPVAMRSSEGPGEAQDVLTYRNCTTCGTEEKKDSWWCIILGENYHLFLTHFSLKYDQNKPVLCRWELQGSSDGREWTVLETAKTNSNNDNFTSTWLVEGKVAAFRYFRIYQTGRNSSRQYGIYFSNVELYGVLLESHSLQK